MQAAALLKNARARSWTLGGIALLAWLYLFGIAVAWPTPPAPGIDPSWMFALGEAARCGLVFGHDLVFTYGPLGYLAVGAMTGATFAPKVLSYFAIAAMLATLVLLRVRGEGAIWQRVVAFCGAGIAIAQTNRVTNPADALFYSLALSFTFPALSAPRPIRAFAFVLGTFGGLFALIKFSFAVDALVVGLAVFGTRVAMHRRDSALRNADLEAATLFIVGFTTTSAAFFASTAYGDVFGAILPVAALAGAVAWITTTRLKVTGIVVAATCTALLAFSPAFRDFFDYSVEQVAGYSSAVSISGSGFDVVVALALFACMVAVAFVERRPLGLPRVVAVTLLLWLIFKEGFVRQDAHIVLFFLATVLMSSLVFLAATSRRQIVAAIALLVVTLVATGRAYGEYYTDGILSLVTPSIAMHGLGNAFATLTSWNRHSGSWASVAMDYLSQDRFAPDVVERFAGMPVDIAGDETDLAFANGLEWNPLPAFQPYTAYTTALDTLNAANLASRSRGRELLSYESIDHRYPFADEPLAYRTLFCDYRLDTRFSQPTTTEAGSESVLVLEPGAFHCGPNFTAASGKLAWNQPLALPPAPDELTFVSLDFRRTALGALADAVYNVPPVWMLVNYRDGSTANLRIVPGTANDGLLLSTVPRGMTDVLNVFLGKPEDEVRSVRFSTPGGWSFAPQIRYRIEQVRVTNSYRS